MGEKQQVNINIPVVLTTWQRFIELAAARGVQPQDLLHRLLVNEICRCKLTGTHGQP